MILKIFASVVTGIGGHYLNRRWDKAILFLCLFSLCLVAAYAFFMFSIMNISSGNEFNTAYQLLPILSSRGIFFLWLASVIITFWDCKNNVAPNFTQWTKSGLTAAILTSIFSFIILALSIVTLFPGSIITNRAADTAYEDDTSAYESHDFYEYLYFGGYPSNSDALPPPPTGDGVLKGKISCQNIPAEGVTLAIVLNSKYRLEDIVTDSEGIFTVNLPPGAWTINAVQTQSWQQRPKERNFSLYYGGEEKLSDKSYNRHTRFEQSGYPVKVSTDADMIHIHVTINENIQLLWPDPKAEKLEATLNDTIRWEQYPSATRYYVEIQKIKRDGSTTYYTPVTSRILSNETSLPLSNLKSVQTNRKGETEYSAEIYAFSEDGTLIAEFSATFKGGTFLLSEGTILITDDLDNDFNLSSIENPDEFEEKMEAISRNKRRMDAVSVLILDNMLHEAESLLERVDSTYSQGKKEVLAGYISNLKGECSKANEMFERALTINPDVCIPETYKENCK